MVKKNEFNLAAKIYDEVCVCVHGCMPLCVCVCVCVLIVDLLFYVHGKHLRSCRDGQLT